MSDIFPNYRDFLLAEFQRRQRRNPKYSWRAFARDLRLTSSRISEIINGKSGISVERAVTIGEILNLSEDERVLFIDLVEMEHGRNEFGRRMAKERLQKRFFSGRVLQPEEFSLISEWHFLPILSLLETNRNTTTTAEIAKNLGIDLDVTENALATLEKIKLIRREENGWTVLSPETRTVRGATSLERRKYNRQLLARADKALDTKPLEERSFTSGVIAVDKEQLPVIRERIRQFHLDLMNEIEKTPAKNAVYALSVQFFELTEA